MAVDRPKKKRDYLIEPTEEVFNPRAALEKLAKDAGLCVTDAEFAKFMDDQDPIASLRTEFFYPKMKELPDGECHLAEQGEFGVQHILI